MKLAPLALLLTLVACGGGKSMTPAPGAPAPAVAPTAEAQGKCQSLVDLVCNVAAGCASGTANDKEAARLLCEIDAATELDCKKAVATTTAYSLCAGEIPAMGCGAFADPTTIALPPDCKGVVLLTP